MPVPASDMSPARFGLVSQGDVIRRFSQEILKRNRASLLGETPGVLLPTRKVK